MNTKNANSRDGREIQNALENDRGKRGGGVQRFAPGQQIRAKHLADPAGNQRIGRKPDDGRFKGDQVASPADGRQQRLPSPGANRYRSAPVRITASTSSKRIGPACLRPHGGRIGLAKEERKQPKVSRKMMTVRTRGRMQLRQSFRLGALRASSCQGLESGKCSAGYRLSIPCSWRQPPRTLLQGPLQVYGKT